MTDTSRGVLIYAHDNNLIEYQKMATVCGALVKKHLGVPVALVTDLPTDQVMESGVFDHVIRVDSGDASFQFNYGTQTADYFNGARANAYDHSPFDETLVIDADYMIHTDYLNNAWETLCPVALTNRITRINKPMQDMEDLTFSPTGIPMRWATVTYFDKSPQSKAFFDMVDYVKNNWEQFALVYGFEPHMYRNDIAYTIAAFILNGNNTTGFYVGDLLGPNLMFAWHMDELMYVYEDGGYLFRCPQNIDLPVRLVNRDVHIMHKESLVRHLDRLYKLHVEAK